MDSFSVHVRSNNLVVVLLSVLLIRSPSYSVCPGKTVVHLRTVLFLFDIRFFDELTEP